MSRHRAEEARIDIHEGAGTRAAHAFDHATARRIPSASGTCGW